MEDGEDIECYESWAALERGWTEGLEVQSLPR